MFGAHDTSGQALRQLILVVQFCVTVDAAMRATATRVRRQQTAVGFLKKNDPVDLENCQQHVTAPAVAKFHAVRVQR